MLRLRELADGDAESVRRIHADGAAADLWFGAMTGTQALAYVREAAANPALLLVRGIEVDGDLLGVVRLRLDPDRGTGRLSYIVREDARGNGHATAAVRRFLTGDDLPARVLAVHREANPASGRVLAKAGFTLTRTGAGLVHHERACR
ncbi:GNAT family N-acetyltransferase [Kitasatospora sp. NPDC057512]|uniref:GNAT family N-acetyltransferase n=1 Tax=Kitasatospora sp. NPDC057512 TaxID=3346154 RepID=UPI0036821434